MANKRFTVFSRKLLLLLLVTPRHDLLCFSAQSGRSLILDPGVNVSLCFSAQCTCQVLGFSSVYSLVKRFLILSVTCASATCCQFAYLLAQVAVSH